jgi:rubrerythrin
MKDYIIKCNLCGQFFSAYRFLASHLNKNHKEINHKKYYDLYIDPTQKNKKCNCGNPLSFTNLSKGYKTNCGDTACISEQRTKKIKNTTLKKYGVVNYTQTKEYKEKVKATCLKKYGVDHHLKSKKIIEKRETNLFATKGVTNVFQLSEIKDKIKKTNLKNLGVSNPQQHSLIKQKTKNTNLNRYGTKCTLQNKDIQIKTKKTNIKLYDNPVYQKSKTYNNLIKNKMMKRLLKSNRLQSKVTPLFEKFTDSKDKNLLWRCTQCGKEFYSNLSNGRIPRCFTCDPIMTGTSNIEIELANFIESYTNICRNKRFYDTDGVKNQYVYELDIFIPGYNIGIELDGIFHHSELSGGKDKYYHINKTTYFKNKGITVIHIFDEEWIFKKDIISSILLSKLHKNTEVLSARKCYIKKLSSEESIYFLDRNHIQSGINSSIRFGLMYKDRLVSVMTFAKSRFNKLCEYELLRFCNCLNTTVMGGFSRLLKHFIKNYSSSIISYADYRFSTGDIYTKNNFEFIKLSPPNYFYIKNRMMVGGRLQFQKHRLSKLLDVYESCLTEWENMQLNGYDRIFDCGNLVYVYKSS